MKVPVWLRKARWVAGFLLGAGLMVALLQVPYINWRSINSPVDVYPLIVRHDAKGDGRFGSPRSGHRIHRGIDLAAPLNTPVRAIRSGTVVQVGTHRGLGNFIELEHGNQLLSLYAHLQQVAVEPGMRVRQGQVIGTVGKTGNAKSPLITPHLHLEVVKAGSPIDPQQLGLQVVMANKNAPAVTALGENEDDASGGE